MDCNGDGRNRSGGLGLLWDEEIKVDLLSFSLNHVDVKINDVMEDKTWRFTGFYGYPEESRKDVTWKLMTLLKDHSDLPWLCEGDFNEILLELEKKEDMLKDLTELQRHFSSL